MDMVIEKPSDVLSRMTMILWGDAGCGKTTLAATAPGRKLFIMLDPDGDMSIRGINDWDRMYLANHHSADIVKEGMRPDPYNISKVLDAYDTIIIDSLTKFSEHALHYGVSISAKSTQMNPGLNGYGARNICVSNLISNMIRITGLHNKHLIMITHEKDADRNDQGNIVGVSMMLGGQLPNIASKDISEVWNMRDQGGKRYIAIRPERFRSPMKSRMFDMGGATAFEWKYDAAKQTGHTIADWWSTYTSNNYAKLPIPK